MATQKTDWGEIKWLDDEVKVLKDRRLQVGIVSVYTRARQFEHIHYEEQVIYCISGQAISSIDGECITMKPGDYYHYRAGVKHEVWNISDEPFVHLLVSNPMSIGNDSFYLVKEKKKVDPHMIYTAVEAIQSQFLETLNYGYVIFDCLGNPVIQSPHFPEYCESNLELL